jgi:cyclic pyranopterin phosphate synthase
LLCGPEFIVQDDFSRQITYLRLSITDRCNLRCFYCAPVQEMVKVNHTDILRYEELLRLARLGVQAGMTKIRVTGGEPLVRLGVESFLASLKELPGLQEICLTTNGVLLAEKAAALWQAGLRRLNISLDSLRSERYARITGRDRLDQVWEGINTAAAMGFTPIKINCVILRGINDDELLDFARLSLDNPWQIRFLEFMPIGVSTRWREDYYLPVAEMRDRLLQYGPLEELLPTVNAGPAQRYRYRDAKGEIGFISPISQHFCQQCNRLRLTADGRLRPCLFGDEEIDLKGPLRTGADDTTLLELFHHAILRKPARHHLNQDLASPCARSMSSIGG